MFICIMSIYMFIGIVCSISICIICIMSICIMFI